MGYRNQSETASCTTREHGWVYKKFTFKFDLTFFSTAGLHLFYFSLKSMDAYNDDNTFPNFTFTESNNSLNSV